MRSLRSPHKARGITLIELLLVLALLSILYALAAPSFARLLARTAISNAQNALATAFHEARLRAVEARIPTVICSSADGRHCNGGAHWGRGWLLGYDRNRDGQPDGRVLSRGQAGNGVTIIGSSSRVHVRYQPDGSSPGSNLTLVVCNTAHPEATASDIMVANSGRIRLGHPSATAVSRCLAQGKTGA